MAEEKRTGLLKRAYLVLRWPVVLVALGLSVVFFLTGLLSSLGYQGTTNLRAVSEQDSLWTAFQDDINNNLFKWKNGEQPTISDKGVVNFDKRLIRFLGYLKNGNKKTLCGWNKGHEFLELDIISSMGALSDLIVPTNKTRPASTLFRGVGVRISKADYIKCTIEPKDPSRRDLCPEAISGNMAFTKEQIPLTSAPSDKLEHNLPYSPGCKVTCAVDYYPNNPVGALPSAQPYSISENDPPEYSKEVEDWATNPRTFDYSEIAEKGQQAGIFKTALLVAELLHTDDEGCATPNQENRGSNRLIPITTILSDWAVKGLGDSRQAIGRVAQAKCPNSFHKNSPLACLASDGLLDLKGLHINY
ncbi:MAG: hypothetical protein ABIJ72_00805 [bacterium]